MKFESQLQIVTAAGVPPFTVNQTALVINLNADLLDGQHGSYYAAASSLGNYLPLTGGTLTGTLTGTIGIFTTVRTTELTSLLGSNGPITITPDGTGHVHINSTDIRLGPNNTNATLATRGTGDLILRTHEGSAVEGFIRIFDGANGNIEITPNGTGTVVVGKLSGSTASFSGQITSTVATGTAPLVITSTTAVTNLNADLLDGQHGAYFENRDATALGFSGGVLTITRAAGNLTANLDGRYLPLTGGTLTGGLTGTSLTLSSLATLVNSAGTSYNENVRFPRATSGYVSLALACDTSGSGSIAGQFNIVVYPAATSGGAFAIRANNSDALTITTAGAVNIPTLSGTTAAFSGAITQGGNQVLHAGNFSAYALPLSGGAITGNTTFSGDNHLTFGPNSTWSNSIRIGGNGYTATGTQMASVATTNGNLHLDSAKLAGRGVYLNWYGGTAGTYFGNGSSGQVGLIDGSGNASFSGALSIGGNASFVGQITGAYGPTLSFYGNACDAASYNYVLGAANDTGNKLVIFVNGSTRTADGGVNSVTIRNDAGPLNLGLSSYVTNIFGSSVAVSGALSATSFSGLGTGLTGTAASLNIGGNAATATTLQTARTINGTSFNGSANIDTTEWIHSLRDFTNGTLITTSINYAVTNGDPFVLEVTGNSYGNLIPLNLLYQGYIYSDTIINHGGLSNGYIISGLVALNVGGNLCFWFPNQGYWNGYNVKVYVAYEGRATNRVASITNVVKPTGTKEVALSANIRQSLHSSNFSSYALPLTGGTISGNLTLNGHLTSGAGYQVRWSDGSAASPGYSFYADTDTGIHRPADNSLSIVTGGAIRVTVDSSGNTGLGGTPYFRLQSYGVICASDPTYNGAGGTGGTLIAALLNNDNTAPGLDLRRWTGSAGIHGTTYISTDSTGATFFYNGQQSTNIKASVLKMTLDASGNLTPIGTVTGTRLISSIATGTAPLSITSTTLVTNLNSDLLDGQHGSYFENRDTTAVGFASGTLTLTRAAGNLTVSLDGRYLPLAGGTMSGDLTATRIRGVNSLILNTYTTVNPASNVFLYSQPNDRDAWLFLDSADTTSNWGIYHRQIDSAVSGLPANSIGFIGGGSSALQAWVSLANGSANFQGALTQAGNQVVHAGNVSTYALPIGGGTVTGNLTISGTLTATGIAYANGGLQATAGTFTGALIVNNDNGVRASYDNGGSFAWLYGYGVEFGRATSYVRPNTNRSATLFVGGASINNNDWLNIDFYSSGRFTINNNAILHAGNYTSYPDATKLPLTGGNITGNVGFGTSSPYGKIDLGSDAGRKLFIYGQGGNVGYITGLGIDLSGSSALSFFTGIGRFEWVKGVGNYPYASYTVQMTLDGSSNLGVTGSVTATNFSGPGTGLTGNAANLTAGAVPWSGITSKPTTLSGFGITDALPLFGGTLTGRTTVSIGSRTTNYTGSNFEVYTGDNTPPGISFHRGGYSATLLYENDGELYVSPWTTRGQTGKLLAAGNYQNYALPLTGGTLTGQLTIATGGATGLRVNSPSGTQGFWLRVGYDTDGTATPVASALNTMLQSSGSSAGTFTIVCGNDRVATLSNAAANFAVALQQGGNQVLHAGNYNSYALGILGDALTIADWNTLTTFGSRRTAPDGADVNGPPINQYGNLLVYGNSTGVTQLHAGHDGRLAWRTKWNASDWTSWVTALDTGNYTNYPPARWATGRTISITGDVTGTSGAFDGTANLSFGVTIANSAVTYAKIQNVAVASVLGNSSASVAQAPAALSMATLAGMLSNQTMNINGSSASCTGNAATATNGFTVKPGWAGNQNLIAATSNLNNSVPSGFYEGFQATNSPTTGTWYNLINVRHSNTGNDHGFQLAMSYYDEVLWSRTYQGGTGANNGAFTTWRAHLHSGNYNSYAPTLTGGGASGSWGISITGSAGSVAWTGVTGKPTTISGYGITDIVSSNSGSPVAADTTTKNGFYYVNSNISLFSQTDGALFVQAYDNTWASQIYQDYRTGQLAIRGRNSGTWQAWRTVLDSTNFLTSAPNSGVTAGTYNNVTVNAKGIVTGGSNVSYLTGNQTITLGGDLSGSGTTSITATIANNAVTNAKLNTMGAGTIKGNNGGVANSPSDLTAAQVATMLSGQTMNIAGSSTSCTGTAATATNATQLGGNAAANFVQGQGSRGRSTSRQNGTASNLTDPSGFYYGANVTGMPTTDWWNWTSCIGNDWSAPDGYGYQLAYSFWSDDIRMRRLTTGTWNSWVTLLHSGNYSSYALPLTGGTMTGAITINGVSNAVVVQTNGNAAQWYGRVLCKNSTSDKASFLGTYGSIAGVFAHNNALSAWADLYINTVDGSTGGTVRMPSSVLINGNQALHAGTTSAPSLSIGGSSASCTGSAAQLNGQAASYYENRDTTAVGFSAGTLTLTRAAGNLSVSLDGRYLTGNQTISLSGDVTGSGATSIATTIAANAITTTKINNSAVTYAKIQNVGAASVLGNTSATVSQAPQEITFANLGPYINGVARAWVTFNENPSTGAITINASLGISSVTRINYGQYRVNFSTAFADANYAVSGTIGYESNGGYLYGGFLNIPRVATPKTTTYCEVTASYGDGNTYNARFVHVVFDR